MSEEELLSLNKNFDELRKTISRILAQQTQRIGYILVEQAKIKATLQSIDNRLAQSEKHMEETYNALAGKVNALDERVRTSEINYARYKTLLDELHGYANRIRNASYSVIVAIIIQILLFYFGK